MRPITGRSWLWALRDWAVAGCCAQTGNCAAASRNRVSKIEGFMAGRSPSGNRQTAGLLAGLEDGGVALDRLQAPRADRIAGQQHVNLVGSERSEEHTSELQSLMRNSYAVFCLK